MGIRLRIWPKYILEWNGGHVALTPSQGVIVSRLFKGRATTYDELIDSLYSDDPNGGPNDPHNLIAVNLCRIRKKLQDSPLKILRVRAACVQLMDGIASEVLDDQPKE